MSPEGSWITVVDAILENFTTKAGPQEAQEYLYEFDIGEGGGDKIKLIILDGYTHIEFGLPVLGRRQLQYTGKGRVR